MEPTHYRSPITAPRGFTLVELIVVLAILSVLTVVAITGQGQFDRSILLTDTAYTVALSVRQAQTLGISSRTYATTTPISNTGYGIHFGPASGSNKSQYTLFADTNPAEPGSTLGGLCPGHTQPVTSPLSRPGDCKWSLADGQVQTYTFNRGYTIGTVCGHLASNPTGARSCIYYDGSGVSDFTNIDVTFLRPNTQSIMIGVTPATTNVALTDLCVHLSAPGNVNPNGNIYISSVGQVAVLPVCPP